MSPINLRTLNAGKQGEKKAPILEKKLFQCSVLPEAILIAKEHRKKASKQQLTIYRQSLIMIKYKRLHYQYPT